MTDNRTPEQIVDEALRRLVAHTRARDVNGFVSMFGADAMLFGSGADEFAVGTEAITDFAKAVFAWPFTIGWSWDEPVAARRDDVLWFVASSTVEPEGQDAPESAPYRLSGVLCRTEGDEWRFGMFNGSEPGVE